MLTLRVLYLGFLPLSGIRPSISCSVVSPVPMRPWMVLFVSLAVSAVVDIFLGLGESPSWFRVMSIGFARKSAVCLVCSLLGVTGPGPGCPGGVVL